MPLISKAQFLRVCKDAADTGRLCTLIGSYCPNGKRRGVRKVRSKDIVFCDVVDGKRIEDTSRDSYLNGFDSVSEEAPGSYVVICDGGRLVLTYTFDPIPTAGITEIPVPKGP